MAFFMAFFWGGGGFGKRFRVDLRLGFDLICLRRSSPLVGFLFPEDEVINRLGKYRIGLQLISARRGGAVKASPEK